MPQPPIGTQQLVEIKKNEFEACSSDLECKDPMSCASFKCQCSSPAQYFDASTSSCVSKKVNNEACTSSHNCRSDLGLSCQNGICLCNATSQFWKTSGTCNNYYVYNEAGCTNTPECIMGLNLKCILSQCTCDAASYWDAGTCKAKKAELVSCVTSVECLIPMTCVASQCQCSSTQYFDAATSTCVTKKLNNEACNPLQNNCRADLGLTCQSGVCLCDSTAQFWHTVNTSCINYLDFSQHGCTTDSHCISGKGLSCQSAFCQCASTHYTSASICGTSFLITSFFFSLKYFLNFETI